MVFPKKKNLIRLPKKSDQKFLYCIFFVEKINFLVISAEKKYRKFGFENSVPAPGADKLSSLNAVSLYLCIIFHLENMLTNHFKEAIFIGIVAFEP